MKPCFLVAVILMSLVGCYEQPGAGQTPPSDAVDLVKRQVARLIDGRYDEFRANADPKTFDLESVKVLSQMTAFIPKEQPQSVKVVAFYSRSGIGTDIAFEYKYSDRWLLIRASVRPVGDALRTFAMDVDEQSESVAEAMTVSLEGMSALHYAVALCALLVPVVILLAVIQWVRLGKFKSRWWWLFAILFGVTQFSLNWHTGEWSFAPLGLSFFGVGYLVPMEIPPLIWPLYIMVSLPLGAVLFLVRRRPISAARQAGVAPQLPPLN